MLFFFSPLLLRYPAGEILSICKAPDDSHGLENATGSYTDRVMLKT